MRCKCCNCRLTTYEATVRSDKGEFQGMCLDCIDAITETVDLTLEDRIDLRGAGFSIDLGEYDDE